MTIPTMLAKPEYRGTARGFAYMFVKLPAFLAIFLFPVPVCGDRTGRRHALRCNLSADWSARGDLHPARGLRLRARLRGTTEQADMPRHDVELRFPRRPPGAALILGAALAGCLASFLRLPGQSETR